MNRALAGMTLMILFGTAAAQDGVGRKPLGTWERQVGEAQVRLSLKTQTLHFTLSSPDAVVDLDADYGVTKTSVLFAIVTRIEKKGTEIELPEGQLFSFRFTISNSTLKVSELKGPETEEMKPWFEGEYTAVKK